MKKIILLSASLLGCIAITPSSSAQQGIFMSPAQLPCAKTEVMTGLLSNDYNEKPTFQGVTKSGILVQIWQSEKTFSILQISSVGVSCIMTAGEDFGNDVIDFRKKLPTN